MILAAANKLKQILWINYIGHVVPEDLKQCREDLEVLLVDLRPGFRLMVDLSQMESMGLDCRTELGAIMELISLAGPPSVPPPLAMAATAVMPLCATVFPFASSN